MLAHANLHDTQPVIDDTSRTYPTWNESGVSLRSPCAFPYYIAPHLVAQRVLGEGGSAIVLEAIHTRLKVTVAVKILKASGPGAVEARERMQREAELCARMDNARIPHVFDVDVLIDGTPYVVMERVRGRMLDELLRNGPLDVDLACTITCDLLEALAELHGAGIVHRDIKPSNLVLEESSTGALRVRVLDLGIAKPFLFETGSAPYGTSLTLNGELLGTPHYMSNEQLLGGEVDERTDLYAVGVMLYEILAGTTPYTGATVGQVMASALHDEPAALSTLRDDLPQTLMDLVSRAMNRDRSLRYASAREMCDALRRVQELERTCAPVATVDSVETATHAANARWAERAMDAPLPRLGRSPWLQRALTCARYGALAIGVMVAWAGRTACASLRA